jgi:cyclic pyranopterin phosphate synthase
MSDEIMPSKPSLEFSHVVTMGDPGMVEIGHKAETQRMAKAIAIVQLPAEVMSAASGGEILGKKGPVFQTARLAGIGAAKQTSNLIPLCHALPLTGCRIEFEMTTSGQVTIEAEVTCFGRTGVEMEALTAVSVAALTVYDMCKALSHHIVIHEIRLLNKQGGKNDFTGKQ